MGRLRFGAVLTGVAVGVACSLGGSASGHVRVAEQPDHVTERVSVGPGGMEGNDQSRGPVISADGRFVTFFSDASNLVPGDTNDEADVFVRDLARHRTWRISVGPRGAQGNGSSLTGSISAQGRYVVFSSAASTLVRGDTNDTSDVFLRDRARGTTRMLSVGVGGSLANEQSGNPVISADGRFVAYLSYASNLVPGDTNGVADAFLLDRRLHRTWRISIGADGLEGNGDTGPQSISADGRYVVLNSFASNLVTGDTNATNDLFLYDRVTRSTTRVSVGAGGAQANSATDFGTVSARGRFIAFSTDASNLVADDTNGTWDVYLRDRSTGTTSRVSVDPQGQQGDDLSLEPTISADGRFVAYSSWAANLTPGDVPETFDVFRWDRLNQTTVRLPLALGGGLPDGDSRGQTISADGRRVAFESLASDLVPADTNGTLDLFVTTLR